MVARDCRKARKCRKAVARDYCKARQCRKTVARDCRTAQKCRKTVVKRPFVILKCGKTNGTGLLDPVCVQFWAPQFSKDIEISNMSRGGQKAGLMPFECSLAWLELELDNVKLKDCRFRDWPCSSSVDRLRDLDRIYVITPVILPEAGSAVFGPLGW
ncbi:hypothetical protein TURU_075852 [Turdus rufiventris]|nr:hypothetical protein TURU_075852 [Turdus rufiventris]